MLPHQWETFKRAARIEKMDKVTMALIVDSPWIPGYLGIKHRIEPSAECKGDAYLSEYQLPRSLSEALGWLADETDLHEMLGKEFITVYSEVKEIEHDEFMKVISPWEREHLLLHV